MLSNLKNDLRKCISIIKNNFMTMKCDGKWKNSDFSPGIPLVKN